MTSPHRLIFALFLLIGAAPFAGAQTCTASASTKIVRVEGGSEIAGDVVVTCTGGVPAGNGITLPLVNFTIVSNQADVVSRQLPGQFGGNWSEALLLVDEPAPAILRICDADFGTCPMTGTGTGVATYNGAAGRYNVFQGERPGPGSLEWNNIPFDPPGPGNTRTFRFTNIRLDAAGLEVPQNLSVTVSISGVALTIANPTVNVAASQKSFSVAQQAGTLGPNGIASFDAVLTESLTGTFKTRTIATSGDTESVPSPGTQNTVGAQFPSESGFYDPAHFPDTLRSEMSLIGLADSGTRVVVFLENIPDDVFVSAPLVANLTNGSSITGKARLITDVNQSGYGIFVPASTGQLNNSSGTVYAVYEILSTDPGQLESIRIPMTVSYGPMSSSLPTIDGAAGLAPLNPEVFGGARPTFGGLDGFTVVVAPPSISTSELPTGIVGAPYSMAVMASGGAPPFTSWSATGLPAGLSISNTGLISGFPTAFGTFNVTVFVSDSALQQGSRRFTLQINRPLTIDTTSLPGGTVPLSYQTTIFASGGVAPYQFTIDGPGVPGLQLSSTGVLSGTPTTHGSFPMQVNVTDASGQLVSRTYTVTITGAPPTLKPTLLKLEFTGLTGGDQPPSQSLALVSSSQQPAFFALTLDSEAPRAAAPSWLTVNLDNGQVPARLTVTTNPTGLAPGTYTARLTITQPNDPGQAPIVIDVTLVVKSAAPVLQVAPDGIEFSATRRVPGKQTRTIAVRNGGGGGAISFNTSIAQQSRWITKVTPASGSTVRDSFQELTVEVDSTGLAVGQYRDVIRVSSLSQTIEVPVTLFVAEGGPLMDLSLNGVQFRIRAGDTLPTTREVKILNRGDAGSTVRWTAEKTIGGDWLTLSKSSGTATTATPDALWIQLAPSAAAKPQGSEYALIKITDTQSAGSPQYLLVVLEVSSPQSPALLDLQTSGVVFFAPPFSSTPQTKKIGFSVSNAVPLAFQASALPQGGGSWLSVTPRVGAVSSAQPAEVTISASSATLAAGVYRGEVVLGRGDTVRAINVTFIVSDPAPVLSDAARSAGTCSPNKLAATSTGMPNHFQVPAGWPATLIVEVYDNCQRAISNATVIASFSNGDPPLTLQSEGTGGVYSATWEPGTALTNVNVTVRATAAGLESSAPLLIGDVTPNRVPKLAHNGTLHNLNPQVLGALSPGVVAQIYGTDLASVSESTGSVPLATTYKGTHVLVGPYDAPLYFVSPTQLVVQFPAELQPNTPVSVVVQAPGGITIPEEVVIVAAKPGVAAFADGRLIVQHANFTLVDAANPAKPGEVLTMYLVGMGATNPPVPSGTRSPGAEPFGRPVVAPTVTVGGQNATIAYAGLTPLAVGLFQINFVVPASAPVGVPLDVVVKQGDEEANKTTLTLAP